MRLWSPDSLSRCERVRLERASTVAWRASHIYLTMTGALPLARGGLYSENRRAGSCLTSNSMQLHCCCRAVAGALKLGKARTGLVVLRSVGAAAMRRLWHSVLGLTRELISLAALVALFVLIWLLWRWGLFEFSYQVVIQDGIPLESRTEVAQGMFTELAGWLISILVPFLTAWIVRRQSETQQTKRSGTLVGMKHLGFMHGLHNRVLSAAEAVIQKNPQFTAKFELARPQFQSEPPSQNNAQMREAIDQHLLLTAF